MNYRTDEEFLVSDSFCFITRKNNPFLKSNVVGWKLNQLPAIKEESVTEEQSELSLGSIDEEEEEEEEISKNLSSLNINCLMNVEVKQSHCIWDTNFGKRLLNLGSSYGVLNEPDGLVGKSQPSKSSFKEIIKNHKKNYRKNKTRLNHTENFEEKLEKKSSEIIKESIHEEMFLETTSNSTEITSEIVSFSETLTPSIISKHIPLAECIKKIFEEDTSPYKCELCDENFSNVEELSDHRNQHKFDKEICLLCEEVFYDSSKFTRHLLTHEGVDKFSCKKCMKYFPNSIKYKKHVEKFHYEPPPVVSYIRPPKLDILKKWCPKFECKKCKIEMDSTKAYEAHKRTHRKRNLSKAYFLL